MKVETFEVDEVTTGMAGCELDEARKLVEQLDLGGQRTLLSDDAKEQFPYRKMTKQEQRIYGLLCPSKTRLKSYDDSAIPLRVLQVAAHAESLGVFRHLDIWHADNADVKDPVLVGWKGESDWSGEHFILARWGEVLLPMSEMMVKAKELAVAQLRQKLQEILSKSQSALASVEAEADAYVNGLDAQISPSCSIF